MLDGNCEQRAAARALTIPRTPSEWLLARYDRVLRRGFGPQGDARRPRRDRGSNFDRRIFDLLDDHPSAECVPSEAADCLTWSGQASWPVASLGDDLVDAPLLPEFADIA